MAIDPISSNPSQSAKYASVPQPSLTVIGGGDKGGLSAHETPKVIPPKPVSIDFDPAKANQSLQSALKLLNDQLASTGRGLGFSYDTSKQSAIIKVTDLKSGEVVRQIPSEEVLRVAHKIDELRGILFNKLG
jgi:flagellar protein FlaG